MVLTESLAALLVWMVAAYAGVGVVFAVGFVMRGAGRLDPNAREGSWGFRVVILPGVAALWPWLAYRWWRGPSGPPTESTAHRDRASGASR